MVRLVPIVVVVALFSLVELSAPAQLAAQLADHPQVPAGSRVRVRTAAGTGTKQFTGTLLAPHADSVVVEVQPGLAPRATTLTDVRQLWVSQGRTGRTTGRGALVGALVGGLAFAFLAASGAPDSCEDYDGLCTTEGQSFAIGFGLGAVPGALIGSVVGFFRRSERWARVR
jgi:hypothetical protein